MVRGHLCTKLLFGDPANRETTAEMKAELNKYQLSLTIPRDALHHGKCTAQCDKLATELHCQRNVTIDVFEL